ncbi:MAG: hypothetical protein KGY67_05200 [Candidatus Thermoplasmatota archaeon]|nr:hypothetical protein [Candidatus Thermoplasmatota archaeon]
MHVKTTCKYFTWKKREIIDFNRIDQHDYNEPYCNLHNLDFFHNCPKDCAYFEDSLFRI